MKYLPWLLALALLAGPAAAQTGTVAAPLLPADSLTHRIAFTGVVAVPGVTAAELQARARQWLALTFEDARQVTQLDDEGRGILIGRGYTELWLRVRPDGTGGTRQLLEFTLRLDFRAGRYRYEVSNLGTPGYPMSPEGNNTPYSISAVASRQAYELSAWQLGATATLEASPRSALLQPERVYDKRTYDLAGRMGRDWPAYSTALSQSVEQLLGSLRRYATAPPPRW